MSNSNDEQLPQELRSVADRLRAQRAEVTPLELDQLKLRARAQANSRRGGSWRTTPVRSRAVSLILASLLVGGTAAGGIAASNNGHNGGSAADAQYRPGLGCGDKNHIHTGPPGNPGKTCH